MNTLRRYLAVEVCAATALVLAALLALFAFLDVMHEIGDLGHGAYGTKEAFAFVLLLVPVRVYDAMPIAALIGTLFALSNLIATSEYMVMRTAGVSVAQLYGALCLIGLVFMLITVVFGEFVGPPAQEFAQRLRSKAVSGVVGQAFRSGLWVKDGSTFINIAELGSDAKLKGIVIYEFKLPAELRQFTSAREGEYVGERTWMLRDVAITTLEPKRSVTQHLPELRWTSVLEPKLLTMLVVQPQQMSAWNLYGYAKFLRENQQNAHRYEMALWAKIMSSLSIFVLMLVSLAFSRLNTRSGGMGGRVLMGIMLGLAFIVTNRLFATLGLLYGWPASATNIAPAACFLALAIAMLWHAERR